MNLTVLLEMAASRAAVRAARAAPSARSARDRLRRRFRSARRSRRSARRSPMRPTRPSPVAPLLVVDLTGTAELGAAWRALATLERLPCPTVGLALGAPSAAGECIALALDVVVERAEDLARLRASAERCPLAAATLVQLLRLGRTLNLHERLVAESLAYSTLQAGPEFAAWLAGARRTGSRAEARSRGARARARARARA